MASRSRSLKHKGLPPYLYCEDGRYYWRHPETAQKYPLGRNKALAVTQAVQANLHLQNQAITLLDRITGKASRTVNDWCDEYEKLGGKNARITYIRQGIGDKILEKLEPSEISTWLDRWTDKITMRKAMLGATKTVLGEAIGKGWIKTNPAADLTSQSPKTRRDRLSLEQFKAIHEVAHPMLKRAMELALMCGARRENVIRFLWADVHDGFLWVQHIKGTDENPAIKVRVPLSLYLPDVGWTLGDAIGRCRDNVVSKFIIHHSATVGRAKPGDKLRDRSIDGFFREAREAAKITWQAGRTPPTFHEIRALASQLHATQGVNVKLLLGHKTDKMSDLYKDRRGSEWLTISV